MPYSLQPVPPGPYNQRCCLYSPGTVMQCGKVITDCLKSEKQVVEILNFCDGPQSSHRHPYSLPDYGGFTDTRIRDPELTELFLESLKAQVYNSDLHCIFAKGEKKGVF